MKKLLLFLLLVGLSADGLKRKSVKKTLYTSKRACDKARISDSNADCSVVDLQIDSLFGDADEDLDLYVLVSEVPVQSVNISPVASGSGTFPTSWGARGVSREPQAIAGTIPSEIQDDIVIITNTRIGFSSTTAKRVSKIVVGQTEYAVPLLGRNALLGGRTVIYQAITGGLPTTGDWDGLIVHFTDGTRQPAGGISKQKRLKYTQGGGGTLYLGDHNSAVFQIPTLASTRLTVSTANTPVFHNIASFTGAGVSGVISQSAVSNIGRVTVAQGGYVNIAFEDEIQIVSSTAGGSGNTGQLAYILTHYGSDGTDKRSWLGEHAIEDPITNAVNIPIGMVSGLTPVEAGDYFTFNFAFNSSRANDVLNLALPADNPGLDERVEFFYWPTRSIVPAGPRGPPGPAGPAGPAGNLLGLASLPTDLSSYVNGEIIFVNTPAPGSFYEVEGADANERHSFRTEFEADANNAQQSAWSVGTDLNYGYSSFGDVFGELYTADGGQAFTASNTPIMRMELEQEVTAITPRAGADTLYSFDTTYTLLIRKTDLTSAPATLFVRFYTGPPASNNQVTTVELMKGSDNPAHDYHTYIDRSGSDILTEDILSIKYFSLFTSSPPTGDQTSNPLNLHDAKSARKLPEGADFSARSADTTKALKLVAEETTPAMPGAPVPTPSNMAFVLSFGLDYWIQPSSSNGTSSIAFPSNSLDYIYYNGTSNYYRIYIYNSFVTGKSNFKIIINGNSYNLTLNTIHSGQHIYDTQSNMPANDRITASSLNATIQISWTENSQTMSLFMAPGPETPESKADTTLDKTGALAWLQSGIDADIDAKVPQQFRGDAVTTGQLFQPTEFAVGTASQITALTKKEGGIYMTLKASQ